MTALTLLPEKARRYVVRISLVGSRVTCSPPPQNTDQDVLVLVNNLRFNTALERLGWTMGGSMTPALPYAPGPRSTGFFSWRQGDLNIIATKDKEFYRRFLAATSVAKRLNLLRKEDRISLFQAVLYGNP